MEKLILVNPQWQGEGRNMTYYGAQEIKQLYLADQPFAEVAVDPDSSLERRHDIFGFDVIRQQMDQARQILDSHQPQKLVTFGGSCSADIVSAAYINQRYQGDVALIYIDAHGDLNSPQESPSGLLYGMPARILLGDDSGLFQDFVPLSFQPEQTLHLAVRGWDKTEWNYLNRHNMRHIPFDQLETDPFQVADQLRAMGYPYAYVHLDVDVLDSAEFKNMTLPGSPGLSSASLFKILETIQQTCQLVGLGIYQYAASGETTDIMQGLVDFSLAI